MSIELKPESSHASTKFGYLKTISTVVLVATLSALALWFIFNIFRAICILRWDFYKSHLILLTQQILNLQSKVETI